MEERWCAASRSGRRPREWQLSLRGRDSDGTDLPSGRASRCPGAGQGAPPQAGGSLRGTEPSPGRTRPRSSPPGCPARCRAAEPAGQVAPLKVTLSTAKRTQWRVARVSHFSKKVPDWDFTFSSKKKAVACPQPLGSTPDGGPTGGAGRRPLQSQRKEARETHSRRDTRLVPRLRTCDSVNAMSP